MCGIAGIINSRLSRDELERVLAKMQENLRHRGPDDEGFFVSRNGEAGLVNTRLAILDLSPAGHQPMHSTDGRYTIVFNGEIYNYASLRAELLVEGYSFVSDSDTEVILAMYERYGPDCVREFEGMFALAIWDEREATCFLARGPLGIKPLYYHESKQRLIFASELRTLLRTGLIPHELDLDAVSGYLLSGAVPEPLTLVRDVAALPAGGYLIWKNGKVSQTKFWDVQFGDDPIEASEAIALAREGLEDSVRRHFVSDVPVGIFLSGGIDSTAIVALSSQLIGAGLRTFSISFDDPAFDESSVARRTAEHFGTSHTDWRLDSTTARSLLEEFLMRSDQPSIDGFNTFCISKLAHDHGLKVVLSGLGGDEVFGGYQSFEKVPQLINSSRWLNPVWPLRCGAGRLLQSTLVSPRMNRLGRFLEDAPTTSAAYWGMRGIFTPCEVEALLSRYGQRRVERVSLQTYVPRQPTLEDEVSYLEITRYMRNQLLRDSDVMSMAWSLELRVPFVDSKLISTVARIPAALRLARGKQLLLDAVPEIPEWVRTRPKQGFTFPFEDWVTGEWSDLFRKLEAETPVRLKNWYRTWCLFALENFLERNGMRGGKVESRK